MYFEHQFKYFGIRLLETVKWDAIITNNNYYKSGNLKLRVYTGILHQFVFLSSACLMDVLSNPVFQW